MALVKTVPPDEAQGRVAEVYGLFRKGSGTHPQPLELLACSPGLFELYTGTFGYWLSHPTLSHDLLNCIRHGVAVQHGFQPCIRFNEAVLRAAGMDEEELVALRSDPDTAPLEDRERALLGFVLKALREPGTASRGEIENLCAQGWTEADIVDATYHGSVLLGLAAMMKAFDV
jgi:alkylhydroperoxidase family enzyme